MELESLNQLCQMLFEGIRENWFSELVFHFLGIIFILDVTLYSIIWWELYSLNKKVARSNLSSEKLQELFLEYRKLFKSSSNNLDTRLYVENFFSDYKVFSIFPMIQSIEFIKKTVSLFILVGVLGTFIGIYTALLPILRTDVSNMDINNIVEVLSGMGTAFSTSIIGMTFSLMISTLLKMPHLNIEQSMTTVMTKTENYLLNKSCLDLDTKIVQQIDSLEETISNKFDKSMTEINNIYNIIKGMDNFSQQFEEAAKHMINFNQSLSSSMEQLNDFYENNKKFTGSFSENMENLNNNFNNLFDGLDGITKQQEIFKEFLQEQNQIQKSNQVIVNKQLGAISNISENIASYKTKVEEQTQIMDNLLNGQQNMIGTYRNLNQNLTNIIVDFNTTSQKLEGVVGEFNQGINNASDNLNQFNNLQENFISKISDIQENYLSSLEQTSEGLNINLQKYNNQMKLLFDFVEKLSNRQKDLSDGYDKMLNSIDKLGDEIVDKMNINIENMTDTLEDFKRKFDNNLNKNIKNFKEHVTFTTDIIQNQFDDYNNAFESIGDFLSGTLTALSFENDDLNNTTKDMVKQVKKLQNNISQHNNSVIELKEYIKNDK